eukprot:TRINITY_DN11001_c0_g1_i1.p1 TRINITY_DN11001_c0_g1~~TRINITY_DN11001_c0_g1_i1.p1  ORF type:complete len:604 (-),score=210.75 TRINITY_DN11001_c0_g1_i1:185-1996(-)
MGAVLATFDDLFFLRPCKAKEVNEIVELFRRSRACMALDRRSFEEAMWLKSPQAVRVFDDLDTDFDGKVDTFEVLLTLILWSCTTWDEKLELLFRCFDFNRKGALRFPELAFMVATTVRTTRRFVQLDLELEDMEAQKSAAAAAFPGSSPLSTRQIALDAFRGWFEASDLGKKLRSFVDEHAPPTGEAGDGGSGGVLPAQLEAPVRRDLRLQDYRVQEMLQELSKLRHWLRELESEAPDRNEQQESLYQVLHKRVGQLLSKLDLALDTLRSELAELSSSMNEATARAGGGAVALVQPLTQLRHDQLQAEIAVLQRRCQEDCREAALLVEKLRELTYGSSQAQRPLSRPPTAELGVAPAAAPVAAARAQPTDQERKERVLDREARRKRGITRIGEGQATNANALPAALAKQVEPVRQQPLQPAAVVGNASAAQGAAASGISPSAAAAAAASLGSASPQAAAPAATAAAAAAETAAPIAGAAAAASSASSAPAASSEEDAAAGSASASAAAAAVEALTAPGAQDQDLAAQEAQQAVSQYPIVVAFAPFDPPQTDDAQMLRLRIGDMIMATLQDEGGWWYGTKLEDGTEGWFPPSYVQVREEPGAA